MQETNIKMASYENIYMDCPYCNTENIYNRRSAGIGDCISRLEGLRCQNCEELFVVKGDTVVSGRWKWFLDIDRHFYKERKEYRLYILGLCQTCECFFEQAIVNELVDRNPEIRNNANSWKEKRRNLDKDYVENLCGKRKNNGGYKFNKAAFGDLRRIFLYQFDEDRKFDNGNLKSLKEDKRESSFKCIEESEIGTMRNNVIHKTAYRPSLSEIESFDCLISSLYWLSEYLKVKD